MGHYIITVKEGYGTYTTSTVGGAKASCTAGARQAVERLGAKLYGDKVSLKIEEAGRVEGTGISSFRLYFPEAL